MTVSVRQLRLLAMGAAALLLLTACSSDDPAPVRAAASGLRGKTDTAMQMYSDLLARGTLEPTQAHDLVTPAVAQDLEAAARSAAWRADPAKLRRSLTPTESRSQSRIRHQAGTQQTRSVLNDLEATARDFEAAWPFASDRLGCMKHAIHRLAANLRHVAASFDAHPRGSRYTTLDVEAEQALAAYSAAVRSQQPGEAATALRAYQATMTAEQQANAEVQAAFVQAAQAAADLYEALEAVEGASVSEVPRIVQRHLPALGKPADPQVTLGRVDRSDWLKRFADRPLPPLPVSCRKA